MCVIIDINTLASVFSENSLDHDDFKPILNWITKGNGKIIYGGTKYCKELEKTGKYNRIFRIYSDARRVIKLSDNCVDKVQGEVDSKVDDEDFDDPHLIAIAIVSKCKIICTKDKRFFVFAKNPDLYPKSFRRPRIYSNKSNKNLINQEDMAEICKPCESLRQVRIS